MSRAKKLPPLPKNLVMPTVVAGINGIGRGQDRQALMEFVGTLGQAMGPEMMLQYINPGEFIKRLASASGIEYLGLVKDDEQMAAEKQEAQQQQMQQQLMGQAGQLAKSPMAEQMMSQMGGQDGQGQEAQTGPPPQGEEA